MQTIQAHELANIIKPESRVFVTGSSNEPVGLLEALVGAREAVRDATFVQFPLPGLNQFDFTALNSSVRVETFFMTPALRKAVDPSRISYLPMQMRYVYEYLRRSPLDHALVQVARDREGQMRLGPNADFFDAVRESAKIVVAELNEGFVAAAGAPLVPETSIDYVVETERPLIETSPSKIDPVSEKIGALVAALIGDGDCIQTGIGAIPAAILASLSQHNDLGLHGGLIDDGGMALVRNGNLNGAAKTRDLGIHTTGMAVGSLDLYEWLADTPSVQLAGANITHEISILGSIGHFVSINSAVEVDLEGQVNAEVIAGRQISGTGGSVDFMRAAKASRGGRSIIAMTATAKVDAVSRIVPKVEMVTALRTDVDIVVTEYGVADLRHATRQKRREALIDIAHPDFRATLRDAIA